VDYVLAQVNVARLREPLDSPLLADFVAALEPGERHGGGMDLPGLGRPRGGQAEIAGPASAASSGTAAA
jgi:Domain of unknown function (DUF3291)